MKGRSRAGMGQHMTFSPHLARAEMSFDLIAIQPPGATFK